jgi:hypothetical protein
MDQNHNIIDLTFLRGFAQGDVNKMKYFIEMHLRTSPALFDQMLDNFDKLSNDELYSGAHSLKPQCDYVGIIGLKDLLVEIEKAAKQNQDREVIKKLIEKAHDLNRKGMIELKKWIEGDNL